MIFEKTNSKMYRIDEKDKVIELKDVPQFSVGAPLPIILSGEHKLLLTYLLQNPPENWDSSTVKIVDYETEDETLES